MKESTMIMLWMLLFLLLLTFWVDLRMRHLREELLSHCVYMERAVLSARQAPASQMRDVSPREDGPASWYADVVVHPDRHQVWEGAPAFYDDLIPSKSELDEAMKGVKPDPCTWSQPLVEQQPPYEGPGAYDSGSPLYAAFPPPAT